jgi:hypothetical protein
MSGKLRRCGLFAVVGLLAAGVAGRVAAMPTCEGTYSATSLRPLPAKIVAGLDIHDRSPEHLKLAERFLAGVRLAGVTTGPRPNVLLHINSSRVELAPDQTDGRAERPYSELSGLQGGIQSGLPLMPDTRPAIRAPASSPLNLRVDATEGGTVPISWSATVQCRRTGTDDGALAQDLGRMIGGVLGRRVGLRPI